MVQEYDFMLHTVGGTWAYGTPTQSHLHNVRDMEIDFISLRHENVFAYIILFYYFIFTPIFPARRLITGMLDGLNKYF